MTILARGNVEALVDWLYHPARSRALTVRMVAGTCKIEPYESLADEARRFAASLAERKLIVGDVVAVMTQHPRLLIGALFGTFAYGVTGTILPPPRPFERRVLYLARVKHILDSVSPKVIVVDDEYVSMCRALVPSLAEYIFTESDLLGDVNDEVRRSCDERGEVPAVIQFTSGSSGTPRGIEISRAGLVDHLASLRDWLAVDAEEDVAVSWLPTHHDMGLIGFLILPVILQVNLHLMAPEMFIRNPLSWLSLIGEEQATITGAPPFALERAGRALDRAEPGSLSLHSLRALIVGAERLSALTVERFMDRAIRHGLRPEALIPAYGLAEATLGVTGSELGRRPLKVKIDSGPVELGKQIHFTGVGSLMDGRNQDDDDWLVSSGKPLSRAAVSIVGPRGKKLSPGHLGEVQVRSPSVASGRLGQAHGGLTEIRGDVLNTGDAGFMWQGELFVLGRLGDGLRVRGRAIFAESLEAMVKALPNAPTRLIAVAGSFGGAEVLVVANEGSGDRRWMASALKLLRSEVIDTDIRVAMIEVPKGGIEWTPTGKPRRRPLWSRLLSGELSYIPTGGDSISLDKHMP
jgi:acyl-CoA synthetase (AMP-forming)/AMP-acid ligase II